MKSSRDTFSKDAIALSLALLPILAIACLLPIQPNDYGWYLRLGAEIIRTGGLPTTEFMSYTQAGQPAVFQHWLAALAFWGVDHAGGALLTNLLRAALLAIFYIFVWKLCRAAGAGRWLAALAMLVTALAGSANWAMRPQLFAYPLFGWALWRLWRWHQGDARHLWQLPLIAVLWINFHNSVPLLFAVGGAALLFGCGERKRLLLWLALALAASLLNPRGALVWGDVLSMANNPSIQQFASEWKPPANAGWQMNLFFGWLLLFPLLAAVSSKRPDRLQWVWFLGLGWLALTGVRYGIWFTAVMGFISAGMLQPLIERLSPKGLRLENAVINFILAGIFLASPLMLLPVARFAWWEAGPPVYSETTPLKAVAWLKAHPELPGPLWADLVYSSHLVSALPERPVWAYTRFETFPPEQWGRYLTIANAEPGWQEALAHDSVRLLMLSKTDQQRLIRALEGEPDWKQVYEDDSTVIFNRPFTCDC